MGRKQGPRKGSMQFWPRSRTTDILPRVNWRPIDAKTSSQKPNLLGFIGYKAGMASAFLKDNTADSMTKGKRIIIPVTLIECPPIKILSVRFYKNGKVMKEVLNENLDKELRRVVKMPKVKINIKEMIEKIEKDNQFTDVKLVMYSQPKKAEIKKTPDISEIAISGNLKDKLQFIKDNIVKEFSITDIFQKGTVDIRGATTGRGLQGPVKRFGIRLRSHKAEKGQRRPGSIGAWHPMGVRNTVPRPGQMGLFQRIVYNSAIVASKKLVENDVIIKRMFTNYGNIKSDYLILSGSVQGPKKRQLLITNTLRPTKKTVKKNYEFIELR